MTTRESRIGTNDGSDACYQYRVALDSTGDFYQEDMLAGAMAGAVVGAATGLMVRGTPQAALIGAVSGAALGAAGGYWYSKMQQGRDQAILSVMSDAQKERSNLNQTQVALDQLVNCRRAEIAKVKRDYKAKRTTKEVAEQRMALIRQQLDKDYEIANGISANVVKRRDAFLEAAENITPGTRTQIQDGKFKQANGKKPNKKQKEPQPAVDDPAAQTIAYVTTAYQTSERVVQAPAQFQSAKLEASLETS
ncbi:hypothetical protein TSA6c_06500 [Azospirillum sp. TSA6c]|nr:hypothetical protein TSA6c_06500 [Azospirillum sp. TSA6c]